MESNKVKEIQQLIKVTIEDNNINEFKNILINNNKTIKSVNSENFDILIFAIENNASFEFIKYIVSLYQSLDYCILNENNKYISPLAAAINIKCFSVIQLLLKNGANINYNAGGKADINIENYYYNYLKNNMKITIQDKKILKYLLNNGYKSYLNLIDLFLRDSKYNSLLKILFEHIFYSIYDSTFILNFLLVNKHQEPLSNNKLKNILLEKCIEFKVDKEWFQNDSLYDNEIALQILCNFIQNDPNLCVEIIHKLYLHKKYENLKKLIPTYFDINIRISEGKTLFDIASRNLNIDFMIYLVKNGAEIDYDNLYINYEFVNKLIEINYPNIIKIIDNGKYTNITSYCRNRAISIQMGYMLLQSIYYDNNELSKYLVNKDANIYTTYTKFQKGYLSKHYLHTSSNDKRDEEITPLILAILKGNEIMVNYLLNKGANVNQYCKIEYNNRVTSINCAIKIKNKNLIKDLLKRGVNINKYIERGYGEELPLEYAIKENDMNMVDFLIQDCGADVNMILYDNESLLIKAIDQNNMEMVELLIDHGADVNLSNDHYSPLSYAINQRMEDMVHYLVEKGADLYKICCHHTPLMNAIRINHHNITKYLIKQGVDINESIISTTPLIYAICHNNINFIKYLIEKHNVDVNEIGNHSTPLMCAIYHNNKVAVKYLVEAGADINKVDGGYNPLSYAIECNAKCIVRYLIEQGADLDEWLHDEPIIVYAINKNRMAIAKCLVDCGLTLSPSEVKIYYERKNSKVNKIMEYISMHKNKNNKNKKRKRINDSKNKNKKNKNNNKKKKKKNEDEELYSEGTDDYNDSDYEE